MTPNGTDLVTVLPNQPEGKSREEKKKGGKGAETERGLLLLLLLQHDAGTARGSVNSAPQQQGEQLGGNLSSLVLRDAADVLRRFSLRSFF